MYLNLILQTCFKNIIVLLFGGSYSCPLVMTGLKIFLMIYYTSHPMWILWHPAHKVVEVQFQTAFPI